MTRGYFLVENDKLILKFIWKRQVPRSQNNFEENNKVGGLSLHDFKIYYKTSLVKDIQFGKKEEKLSMSTDGMILYRENFKDSTHTSMHTTYMHVHITLKVINEFSKVAGYGINTQKQVTFLKIIFILYFVYVLYHINWFVCVEPSICSWDEPHLITVIIFWKCHLQQHGWTLK